MTIVDSVRPSRTFRRERPSVIDYDTTIIRIIDSIFVAVPYEAIDSNRVFDSGDTLRRLTYRFPENVFSYDFRPRPDSVKLLRETVKTTVPSEPRASWSIGLCAGYGFHLSKDDVDVVRVRTGPFLGIGITRDIVRF